MTLDVTFILCAETPWKSVINASESIWKNLIISQKLRLPLYFLTYRLFQGAKRKASCPWPIDMLGSKAAISIFVKSQGARCTTTTGQITP